MRIGFEEAVENLKMIRIRTNFAAFLNQLDITGSNDQKAIQDQLKVFFGDLEQFLNEANSIYIGYKLLANGQVKGWDKNAKI